LKFVHFLALLLLLRDVSMAAEESKCFEHPLRTLGALFAVHSPLFEEQRRRELDTQRSRIEVATGRDSARPSPR
jgi:hypothetical protein